MPRKRDIPKKKIIPDPIYKSTNVTRLTNMIMQDGKKIKRYNGMASKVAQKAWKGSYNSIEGVASYVPYKGTTFKVLNEIMSNVRSGMSYSGANTLDELRKFAEFRRQTNSSNTEGNAHIFNRSK